MLLAATLTLMAASLRPPALPLVVHSPFFSAWVMGDRLAADWARHWSGGIVGIAGLVRIDGKAYRWLGPEGVGVPAMAQTEVRVEATRTIAVFRQDGVELTVQFWAPMLPGDVGLVARPVTYVDVDAKSLDGRERVVDVYLDATGEWTVKDESSQVVASRHRVEGLEAVSISAAAEQRLLSAAGDRVKADWGRLFLAVGSENGETGISGHTLSRSTFAEKGELPASDDLRFPRPARDDWPVIAARAIVGAKGATFLLAFDEMGAIEYFGRRLAPYWTGVDREMGALLARAAKEAPRLRKEAHAWDAQLRKSASALGGEKYADLCALAYRQCLGAHGIVEDADGDLLMFSKENTSNGCIGTVDVTFPASPFFLALNPELLAAQLRPVFEYASSKRWRFPFAPHDLGTYPLANGQVYGGGERSEEDQMPVEESANMILMAAALMQLGKGAELVERYWRQLETWAKYLEANGFDPPNQLCTDDFTGHLAHNVNLSLKAICAIGAFADLCERHLGAGRGKPWRAKAEAWAKEWAAKADDGGHFRLAFDRPGTWSLKYNLLWDRLLGLGLFPEAVVRKEVGSYRARFNKYGIPLDNRATFTKTDWLLWVAALAKDREEFDLYVDAAWRWMNESPSRVPLTDWYDTVDGRTMGMYARSVIGGVFAPVALDAMAKARR